MEDYVLLCHKGPGKAWMHSIINKWLKVMHSHIGIFKIELHTPYTITCTTVNIFKKLDSQNT